MIKHTNGNLLNSDCDILVNAVNPNGYMSGGIALQFAEKYPEMVVEYNYLCDKGIYLNTCAIFHHEDKWICNLCSVDCEIKGVYEYIEQGLKELELFMSANRLKSAAIPPLGCGIGGLDKKEVLEIIEDIFEDFDGEIVLYNFK